MTKRHDLTPIDWFVLLMLLVGVAVGAFYGMRRMGF